MRDPSDPRFVKWQELMYSGDMVGPNRPVGRITIGKNRIRGHSSDSNSSVWRNVLFEQPRQVEMPYVKSINISRAIDNDSDTCSIVIYNDAMFYEHYAPQGIDTGIGRPGYRSPSRGEGPDLTTEVTSVYDQFDDDPEAFPTDWEYPPVGSEPGGETDSGHQYYWWTHPSTGKEYYGYRAYDGGTGGHGGPDAIFNKSLLIPNRLIRCVDTETEIMTTRGWLRWDEVEVGDEALGINPDTGNSEWQAIEEVFHSPYEGGVMRLTTKVHDSITTPNHRWLVRNFSGDFEWRTTETLSRYSQIPLCAPHMNTNAPIYSNDFVELAAWYFTEGTAEHRLRSMDWGGNITQSETANPENVSRIRELFYRLYGEQGDLPRGKYIPQETVDEAIRLHANGLSAPKVAKKLGISEASVRRWSHGERCRPKHFKWSEKVQGQQGGKCFQFTQEVARPLREVVCGPDKIPSIEFLNRLTQSQLELFIEVSILGDGSEDRGSLSIKQASLDRIKAFEYACVLAGHPIHTKVVRNGWETTLLRWDHSTPVHAMRSREGVGKGTPVGRPSGHQPNHVPIEPYDDIVWCPRVEHGNWLARRNGSVFFTGNTFQGYGSDNFNERNEPYERGDDPNYVSPMDDSQLVQTGVWLIDTVQFTADGHISIECRDVAKILLTQVVYPDMVPMERFPLVYRPPDDDSGKPGKIDDWNVPIKELLGWGGFTWWVRSSIYPNVPEDPIVGSTPAGTPMRVWGDFEVLGAWPVVPTKAEWLINKSFMEAITLVKDMIGAIFFIDESGGAVFRLPNIYSAGNFISGAPPDGLYAPQRIDDDAWAYYSDYNWPIEFHENANLVDYTVTLDDSQIRGQILVIGEQPDVSARQLIAGGYEFEMESWDGTQHSVDFKDVLAGQTRLMQVPGDDTKGFSTVEETQRMAEMIALRMFFSYRRGQVTAPCHPGLQLDDQVRIFERITHEYNIHYVSAFDTNMDLETGEWMMNVTTHWLGRSPQELENWFLDKIELTDAVKQLPAVEQRLAQE